MLNVATIEDYGRRLLAIAASAAAKIDPLVQDGAKLAELIDPVHAPEIAAVAQIAGDIDTELHQLEAGQTNASEKLIELVTEALVDWRAAKVGLPRPSG